MVYRSKKDWWLVGLVWGSVLGVLAVGLFNVLARAGDPRLGWPLVRAGIAAFAVVLVTTFPLNYEIAGGELSARSGVLRWRVPLASIQEVAPSRNPASAPTWSLDRLRIDYLTGGAERTLYVSPEDKAAFMRDLADAAPGLEWRGERLVRVG